MHNNENGKGLNKSNLNVIEERNMEYDIKEEEVDLRVRIYMLYILLNVFLNYDTGVIPGALVQISDELGFNNEQMAYLGSFVYLGLCAATFFGSYMFHKFQVKWVLSLMVLLNSGCCFLFAYSSNILILYVARFILGFSQAFVVIYAPVWINEFSPAEANTRWMAGFHSACVVGILGGYIVAQTIVNHFSYYTTWRFAIYIQG
jgi:MFS family permease